MEVVTSLWKQVFFYVLKEWLEMAASILNRKVGLSITQFYNKKSSPVYSST